MYHVISAKQTTLTHMDLDQHWFRQWLVAWRHQAITGTSELALSGSYGIYSPPGDILEI